MQQVAGSGDRRVPLLVKIAPDLADDDVLAVADLAVAIGLDGIIATNTTISRDGLATPAARVAEIGAGGLSGRPLTRAPSRVVRLPLRARGSGPPRWSGSAASPPSRTPGRAWRPARRCRGYTAFVYEGPLWPRRIVRGVQGGRG